MDRDAVFIELLAKISQDWAGLADKPMETPSQTLHILWKFSGGQMESLEDDLKGSLPDLDPQQLATLRALVQQRCEHTPLAYLVGRQKFMGIELLTGPEAMIPRLETEILGRAAVEALRRQARERGQVEVLDLCCGSGNLALALAHAELGCWVTGADISPAAVGLAARNAAWNGLEERVNFVQSDLFSVFENESDIRKFDLITCNPPYISSAQVERLPEEIRAHEPRLAFDGGTFGIRVISRLLRDAPRFMKGQSFLCFEVGAGQGKVIENLLKRYSTYNAPELFRDEQGQVRAVRLTRLPGP